MSQIDTKIGPKIKAFRRQLGIQANKLAEEMSISPSYLNLIESGKRKIDGDLLLRVCDKLKIELSDLTSKTDINLENNIWYGPFKSIYGDHLLYVFEVFPEETIPFEDAKQSVIVNYNDEIKNEVMNNYMYSIIDKYDVIIGEYK